MREARSWIFLAVGVLLAAVTGLALYGLSQQVAQPQLAAANSTIQVLVAKVDLPLRTVITADALSRKTYPADLVPVGAVSSELDAIGLTTIAPITRGQTIVAGQLAAAEGKKGASVTLQKGLVLVSFPTTDPLTIGGLVNVGDRVDILASVAVGPTDGPRTSQTTLQNLEVVDIVGPTKEQPQRATALVFAVDHQVALVLKYLRDSQASVDIAIRSRAETELARTTGVDLGFLVQTYGFRR
jgi:Flp pilus assembly protein CpaB